MGSVWLLCFNYQKTVEGANKMEVTLELQLQISLSLNEGFPTRTFKEKFFNAAFFFCQP